MASGDVAEWLGGGLQNLIQRFKSARRLHINKYFFKVLTVFSVLI